MECQISGNILEDISVVKTEMNSGELRLCQTSVFALASRKGRRSQENTLKPPKRDLLSLPEKCISFESSRSLAAAK